MARTKTVVQVPHIGPEAEANRLRVLLQHVVADLEQYEGRDFGGCPVCLNAKAECAVPPTYSR